MTEIRGRQNNGSKSQQAGVKRQKWPQTKRPTPTLTLAPRAQHPSGSRTVLPSFPARPPPIAHCAPINADPFRKVAASTVRARKGFWAPAPGRTRPPRRPSSTTLRSALRAREAARAACSEEDEAATAAADNDCALAASRSHCEARSRGLERAPRLPLQHPWLRPQEPRCSDSRPRTILAYDPKTAGFLVASDAARIALLIRLFKMLAIAYFQWPGVWRTDRSLPTKPICSSRPIGLLEMTSPIDQQICSRCRSGGACRQPSSYSLVRVLVSLQP
ncbi:unnamed protein product [Miscanthus lutarioriparius]|uniref:Uncharacterized protein n=1 Tax=Miscanthus lutarioriparius TaxID=422564 RepID=A0A811NCS9_9POAL|nr:unnamed protein product [Miscanthus lutarioriparius]